MRADALRRGLAATGAGLGGAAAGAVGGFPRLGAVVADVDPGVRLGLRFGAGRLSSSAA